ncbi:MAG: helix-turn-helix domain-containing protein [Actinomycetota bacterium]|nr:helix-turn-helix domain-containing protein [Actinomycetota bacterium]
MTLDLQPAASGLVDLLGDTRARVVECLRAAPASVAALAAELGLSEVAIRRHLQVLERDGLVSAATVRRRGPGRPGSEYALTDKARRLFPDNSAALANELLAFLEAEHGRGELRRFLRWRAERQSARYATALDGADTVEERTEALARVLSDDGFASTVAAAVAPDGATVLTLTQGHCAIKAVAEAYPEVCAYEASLFKQLLGGRLSRRETIAGGANACVCHITPADPLSR